MQAPWSPASERIAGAKLANGRTKAVHFTLLQGPCICCPENKDEATVCEANGGAVRKADTLFNNEIVISILSADQLGRLLRQANALFASSRALLEKMAVLKPQIEQLDVALLECDQQPCSEAELAISEATEPSDLEIANNRVSQTFALFAGLAFKNTQMSADLDCISGSEQAFDDAAVSSAAFSFGLMAYPFAGLPLYLSAEGMVFAGNEGRFPTPLQLDCRWGGRISVLLGIRVAFNLALFVPIWAETSLSLPVAISKSRCR